MIAYGKIMLQFYTYMHIKSYLHEMNDVHVIIRLIWEVFFRFPKQKILKFSSDKEYSVDIFDQQISSQI